ncbi:MAG: ubiquitin-like domain-containing protein [Sciscionella sp.]
MTGIGSRATALLDRDVRDPNSIEATSEINWFGGFGSHGSVTTGELLAVLGPDADDLLATTRLDVAELVDRLNAETTLLPAIDAEFEAEIEEALAGVSTETEPPSRTEVATAVAASPKWRKRMVRAAIGAILLAATGGATAAAMNKAVTVDIDGQEHTVHTFDSTVGQLLADEGITPHAHDVLSPSPTAAISDGGKVVLERGRLLKLQIDGVEQDHWTRATTVGEALRQLNVKTPSGAIVSQRRSDAIPLQGATVAIKTLKHLTVIDGTNAPHQVDTNAVTVGEFLKSQHLTLGKDDSVSPSLTQRLTDGAQVLISRTGVTVINQKQSIDPPVQQVSDNSMYQGQTQVVDPGTPGQQIVTFRITQVNGKETNRVQLAVKVLSKPKPKIIKVGTKQPTMLNEAMWDKIAQCESSGNWHDNTGNGYYGGLQFNNPTWLSNGGGQYAPRADLATKAEQIDIANKVYAARGLQPWQCADSAHLNMQ